MSEKQANNLMYFLWHQGYLKSNVTEDHSDYDYIVELITKRKLTDEFINDIINYK